MAIYCVGDIHGCYKELRLLLNKIDFSPSRDKLYVLGDMVNRGPNSAEVLRYLIGLNGSVFCILGNHDIHTLAVAAGVRSMGAQDTIADLLNAPDAKELLQWLRQQPLALYKHNCLMVHAGVQPSWDIEQTIACASEVSQLLCDANWQEHIPEIFGNQPDIWHDGLRGWQRWRCSVNTLTRMRMVEKDSGAINFTHNKAATENVAGLLPWYMLPQRKTAQTMVFFGHWAALGLLQSPYVTCLDSGCVWGGALSAAEIEPTGAITQIVQVPSSRENTAFKMV